MYLRLSAFANFGWSFHCLINLGGPIDDNYGILQCTDLGVHTWFVYPFADRLSNRMAILATILAMES